MRAASIDTFRLSNFEGPLEFLLHLIQKEEMDIYEVPLNRLIEQFQKCEIHTLDSGAEFLGNASFLLWLKSKTLLPKHEQDPTPEELELDPRFEIIHQLLEYCRFKQAAKEIALLEQKQGSFYLRGGESAGPKKPLGIDHLSIDDLAQYFSQALAKSAPRTGVIEEEEWKVSDKLAWLAELLEKMEKVPFSFLFSEKIGRIEMIVTFLAILELMKMGRLKAIRIDDELYATARS